MPPALVGLGLGALAVVLYMTVFGKGAQGFVVQGGSKFWPKDKAGELKAKLQGLKASPIPGVERAWSLAPTGAESALARVQAIQAAGSFAVTTDNLLSGAGPMGLSQVLATEVATLAPASGSVAVLPAIT